MDSKREFLVIGLYCFLLVIALLCFGYYSGSLTTFFQHKQIVIAPTAILQLAFGAADLFETTPYWGNEQLYFGSLA